MTKKDFIDKAVKISKACLLQELKEDYNSLSFVWSIVHENLGLPENLKEMTLDQRDLLIDATLSIIFDFLKNRGCKVFSLRSSREGDWAYIEDFVEWNLSPDEAVEKVKSEWMIFGDNASFEDQPWFKINKDSQEESKNS